MGFPGRGAGSSRGKPAHRVVWVKREARPVPSSIMLRNSILKAVGPCKSWEWGAMDTAGV